MGNALVEMADGRKRFRDTEDGLAFKVDDVEVNLKQLLCWASAYSYHHTTVFHMTTHEFEMALEIDLLAISSQPNAPLKELWSQQFAYLLKVSADESSGLTWRQLEKVAASCHPPPPEWPPAAQALAELWNNNMHPKFAEALSADAFFAMLKGMWSEDRPRAARYLTNLVMSVQVARLQLPVKMQKLILLSGLTLPDEVAKKHLVYTFIPGLRELEQEQQQVNIPICKFKDLLKGVAHEENLSFVMSEVAG